MEDNPIKISVIIPLYNVEKYVKETLLSLISQSFKAFELIIVDDGSTDRSADICENILKESCISYKIIRKKNQGVSKARNIGVENSSGEYIFFLDSDDYISSTALMEFYNKAIEDQAEVVFCGYEHIDYESQKVIRKLDRYIEEPMGGLEAAALMAGDKFWISAISGFYLRSLIVDNKIVFPENICFGEDTVFIIKALMNSKRVTCVKQVLSHYIRRKNSVTKTPNESYYSLFNASMEIYNYNERSYKSQDIRKAMVEFQIPHSIIRIFTALSTNSKCKSELMEFTGRQDIRRYLKQFKINGVKANIKYKIFAVMILINRNLAYNLVHFIKEVKNGK
ncbi:Glycosyltransferase involved in cell wall bisynthesis [Hathewaya proteolytica DSM 3090]|uniref:Glycosyltransferase involved in cell wall bisynthesis n=1 Tax=Hathewaya proteolytica DSM 3090 TaxID=1121331 RepID=A0A1M6PSW2_9CLOT|nr:glycosyltransferase family 2 protein [Hathewaya proteolytica]SHK11033.1 Glycosyltransferase involved in cell wall bisynthesis [Hathewaya proteolytica DSM 3090]